MTTTEPQAAPAVPKPRWYHPTPDRFVLGLLAAEGVLLLSEWFRWFPFNEHKGWTVLIAIATVVAALLFMLLWFAVSLLFRWRFQYSIRSLLVLTVAVAIPCSWLGTEMRAAKEQKGAVAGIKKVGGKEYRTRWPIGGQPAPPWLLDLLGEDFFTDANMVIFNGTEVTDAELGCLEGQSQLQGLWLHHTRVTDAGLEHLKELSQLQVLWINGAKVTDAGLEHLRGLTQLRSLLLYDTKVTAQGVKKLQEALPACGIVSKPPAKDGQHSQLPLITPQRPDSLNP